MWACGAAKTEYEAVFTMPGQKKEGGTAHPDFLAKFPSGTVPSIEDDGFFLSESHAILTYLGEKHRWALYPDDPKIRAKIQQYFNWYYECVHVLAASHHFLICFLLRLSLGTTATLEKSHLACLLLLCDLTLRLVPRRSNSARRWSGRS
jgi:glutathione S-transferase